MNLIIDDKRFQWAKIWISLFYPPKPIRFSEEAIRLLENLENLGDEALTKVDYLNDAYWRRYNKNAQNEADRKYMIRAYRIILCSYRPLSLSELAEAVSIRSDSTLDPDIIDDDEFLNLKSLCHNFLKFPKSPEGEESFVEFVHDSARLFILTMRASANVTGKAEDFSDVNNHLEMTKMCLAVMRNSNHAIWRRARPHISPTDWVQRWERLEQDHDWSKQDWDLFRKRAANTLMMCNEDHFAVYICLYWLQHCQELARLQGDTTPLSSDLIQALFQDESAFRGWVFYVIMVDPASERSRRRGHLHGLKWRVESILKLVKEGRFFQPSPLFVITKWDLFRHLSSSQDYEAAFRRNYQASAKRSSTRGNPTFTPPWKIDDSLVAGIFQDQYSRNVFGQIALHTAADHLFPGAIWPLFLGKRDANLEEQLKFLLLPDHSKMNALHLAASFGSTAWEQGRALATLREILRVEAVLNEYGSPLPAEQPRRRLATSRDSRGRIPMEILANTISSWAYIRGYRCTPEVLDIVCEMLHDVEPSFDEGVCMALLDLRGYLSETNQAKKLWDAVASKKQGTIAEVMAKLYPKLLQEGPHGLDRSMWEARMTGIVDFNPETIRSEDAFGNTSLMKYLLDPEPSLKKKHVRFLANAHGKHFGWKGYSTYHFQYLKSTCSSPDILHSLKALGADLSLRDSNGDALLHFFGHNTAEPRDGEEQTYSRHNIYTCPYLDSAEDLRVLLLGNGRLFDCDSQGITAFSDILEKIQCHIGYVAFVLLCKCGLDNKFWLGDLWIGRYRKFNGTTLLDYLSLIIAAYQQRDPAGGSRTIEISLNNALLESFPAEDVTLEEVMKYGHEIGILRQKWETLMGIENEKWVPDALPIKVPPKAMEEHVKCLVRRGPLPRNGRYKKGPWEDQLAWAHDFLSEDEIEKMEARLRNAEGYGVDYWERIKIRKGGEEGSRTGRRGEDSPTSPLR
jgi:hypothetical protein